MCFFLDPISLSLVGVFVSKKKKKKKTQGIEATCLQAPQTIKRKQHSILGVIICVLMSC